MVIVVVAIVAAWLAFVAFVAILKPDDTTLRDALRLLPDIVRLVRRLVADREIPRGTRWLVWFLLGYLVFPIDIVPDFIPVLGYADDAIIVAAALRSVVRRTGIRAVERHWPGTHDGFAALCRLTGLTPGEAPRPAASPAGLKSSIDDQRAGNR